MSLPADEAQAVLREVDREAQSRVALGVDRGRGATPGSSRGGTGAATRAWLVAAALNGTWTAVAACAPEQAPPAGDHVAATAFARGVRAYAQDRVSDARVAFLDAAARAPRAPDAWANAGTAAWAAGDTLAAAIAWQRAVRLEPAASDVRDRLALLPAAQDGWIAGVPPIDPDWLARLALALALVAGALALRAAVRVPLLIVGGRLWMWVWGAALAAAGAGGALAAHADPADRAVVTTAGPLRTEPMLGAEPGSPADRTDVARVVARQATWTRVALDGGRDGWIESARLAPLAITPALVPGSSANGG